MSNTASRDRVLCGSYVLLFTFSGLAGLIYESVWTHYLKLFLGHAAHAQTLVLCIFMGGMAAGAWAASRVSGRFRNVLAAYAAAEALIGLAAILFHPVFVAATRLSYDSVIPALGSPLPVGLYKWALGAALILPQSVVLGATFPLMSAGIIRRFPRSPGRLLATAYFANSLGAAAGVLVSGFYLIGAVGLPGTMLVAGVINCAVAAAVWGLSRCDASGTPAAVATPASPAAPDRRRLLRVFLLCAAATGTASFIYEIAWIRMLGLVLGSSTHAFELMLSAFILGLAIGGAAIRRSIDSIARPVVFLAGVQIVMGVLAMLSIVSYGLTFDVMGAAIHALAPTDAGYALFNVFSHGLCLLVMLPATVCAGMTLPLITAYLFTRGVGEASIGRVYAANTVGAIAGVVLAVGLVMPWLGVRNLVILGGTLDAAVGIGLLLYDRPAIHRTTVRWVATACVAFIAIAAAFFDLDPRRLASGVFRRGMATLGDDSEVLFHRDGRTATIDRVRLGDRVFVATNGKPDAGLAISPTQRTLDEDTMILLAAIPWGCHPAARTAAVIGLGSGMTTHTLLDTPLETVDTIEIEPAMVAAARGLGEKVANAFGDPRSRIHIADAKTFFAGRGSRYDLIISEPSNPWVSGVSGLFSVEFYDLVRRHLADDGLLAQWIHLYEIEMPLVASVTKAIGRSFDDYAVYGVSDADIVILASVEGPVPDVDPRIFEPPALRAQLDSIGVRTMRDVSLAKLGTRATLDPFMGTFPIGANSDYYPALDLGAVRARYLHDDAFELYTLGPLAALFDDESRRGGGPPVSPDHPLAKRLAHLARQADAVHQYFAWKRGERGEPEVELAPEMLALVRAVRSIHGQADRDELEAAWLPALYDLAARTLPHLSGEQMAVIWDDLESAEGFAALSDDARTQVLLLRAIGEGDHELVASLGERVLATGRAAGGGATTVLLATMASRLALDDPRAALALWYRHAAGRGGDVRLRWMAAQAAARSARQRVARSNER